MRQRRESPARPRDRPPARNRDPRGHRRLAWAHHPPAADGKRRPVACGRRARADRRMAGNPRASVDQHCRPAARRHRRQHGRARLARRRLHDRDLARHGHPVRPDSRAAKLEDEPDDDAEGKQRTIGHRVPPEQGAIRPGGGRGCAGAGAADRFRAADPHRNGARAGRSGLRHAQRADDADVAQGRAVREGRSRRTARAQWRRAVEVDLWRCRGKRDVLRAAPGRLRTSVPDPRTPVGR